MDHAAPQLCNTLVCLPTSLSHLMHVLIHTRQYFGRTWVIQEFVQARRLWLLCGMHRIDCFDLFHFQKALSGTQAGDLLNHRWQHGPDRQSDPLPHDVLQAILWLVTTLSSRITLCNWRAWHSRSSSIATRSSSGSPRTMRKSNQST